MRSKPAVRAVIRVLLWPIVTALHGMRALDTTYALATLATCLLGTVLAAMILSTIRRIVVELYSLRLKQAVRTD